MAKAAGATKSRQSVTKSTKSSGDGGGKGKVKAASAPRAKKSNGGDSDSGQTRSGASASELLIKLLESPIVAELLAIGASAALASLAAQRFGRTDDARGTRRALKDAAKSAARAMGQRLATEVEEIRRAAQQARDGEAA